jgi:hypothetical protein
MQNISVTNQTITRICEQISAENRTRDIPNTDQEAYRDVQFHTVGQSSEICQYSQVGVYLGLVSVIMLCLCTSRSFSKRKIILFFIFERIINVLGNRVFHYCLYNVHLCVVVIRLTCDT